MEEGPQKELQEVKSLRTPVVWREFQFQFQFQFHLLSINPKYNLTKDTLLLRTYMITTIKTKSYRLTILKIMINATYMIVFKIDRLRRSSLRR